MKRRNFIQNLCGAVLGMLCPWRAKRITRYNTPHANNQGPQGGDHGGRGGGDVDLAGRLDLLVGDHVPVKIIESGSE